MQSGITRPVCGVSRPPRALLALFFNFDRAAAHRHLWADCGLPRGPWTGAKALVCAMHQCQAVPAQNRAFRRVNSAFERPRLFVLFFPESYYCDSEYSDCLCQQLFQTGFFEAILLPAHSLYERQTSPPHLNYSSNALCLVSAASFAFPRRYGPISVATAVSVF